MREEFKQREKRIEIENKITKQKVLDGYRMELLKAEDSKKTELKEMVQKQFASVTKNSGKYKEFLKQAMIQAFLLIWDEEDVTISCRKQDQKVVQSLMDSAMKEVKSRAQK